MLTVMVDNHTLHPPDPSIPLIPSRALAATQSVIKAGATDDLAQAQGTPATALEVSDIERKLEYLLRTIEARLGRDLAVAQPYWSSRDTDLLDQLVEEHEKVGEQGTMRLRTMRTSSAYYSIFLQCRMALRADDVATERFEDVRNKLQNVIFDVCEESKVHTRKEGYQKLMEMCKKDVTLLKSNVWALVQLLQNDGDYGAERKMICEVLAGHLKLAKEVDDPGATLTDCLKVMFDKDRQLHSLVLEFFNSESGQTIVDMMTADNLHAAVLACCLAGMLPAAVDADITKALKLLYDLQSIWTGPNDVLSAAETSAALDAAVDVLWSLGQVMMDKRNLFVFSDSEVELSRLMEKVHLTPKEQFVQGGIKVFSELVQAIEQAMSGQDETTVAQTVSEAKKFVDNLEASAVYLFCYLPIDTSSGAQHPSVIEHFSADRRIVLFRSAANLAARVASAEKDRPRKLDFPGEQLAKHIAQVTARALKVFVPVRRSSGDDDDKAQEQDPYIILAGEALLTAIHRCDSCISDHQSITWTDKDVREKVRSLASLAQEIVAKHEATPQVLGAAKVVCSLTEEFLHPGKQGDVKQATPMWLMPPPPFPEWIDPAARVATPEPAAIRGRAGRRRRSSQEDNTTEERRVRGRGAVHYRERSPDHGWDSPVKAEPSTPALAGQSSETGLTIRGTSRAEYRSPADRRAPEDPGHAGPLSASLAERMTSDRWSGSARPRSQDRPKEERDEHAGGWGDRRDASSYGHSRRDRWGR
ncbi:hypothetical protein sr14271 [Sporisorium reilianum SRZ2]|uniref:Uncharacterized protein n=1 Tax=Sporisorium reilianum (strain SRZ2) TaxID=999809 RepID=E7A2G9_SPORE|nr:hypothetical protein sr14271 [Sporisorium reilianum SRZ2]